MRTWIRWSGIAAMSVLAGSAQADWHDFDVSPDAATVAVGASTTLSVDNALGQVAVKSLDSSVVQASYDGADTVTLQGVSAGTTRVFVRNLWRWELIDVQVSGGTTPTDPTDPSDPTDPNDPTNPTNPTDPPTLSGDFTLLAWNDLGMHCVDGNDYSVFSILPPYNNLHAQLVNKSSGELVSNGVTLTYKAVADPSGSVNTSSSDKTNFWDYVDELFGVSPSPDTGLTGNRMASYTPQPLQYNADQGWFEAEGIPITPVDDFGNKNFYPLVQVEARDNGGNLLASTQTVLPVSDEMSCKSCHASTSSGDVNANAARPVAGWVFNSDPEKDWKQNILRLHDEKHLGEGTFDAALAEKGYSDAGLFATASQGTPILCASCHGSNALPGTGVDGIPALTQAIHGMHAEVKDPANGLALDAVDNRGACYLCHPGSETECLRGAMGAAQNAVGKKSMSCQSCHGGMSAVGSPQRVGWLDEPNCQSCHHDGQRKTNGVDASGHPLQTADDTFATDPNTPQAGFSLYRFSTGHGGLQCEACHGSTHAIYPSAETNDNLMSVSAQGHSGTVSSCLACHDSMPRTSSGGPHGMHSTGQIWVDAHEDFAEHNGAQSCAYCHGADYRGSPLSEMQTTQTFRVDDYGNRTFAAGHQVGCYDCHNGPDGEEGDGYDRDSVAATVAPTNPHGTLGWETLKHLADVPLTRE